MNHSQLIKRLTERQSASAWVQNFEHATEDLRDEPSIFSITTKIWGYLKFDMGPTVSVLTEPKWLTLGLFIDAHKQPFEPPHPLTDHPLPSPPILRFCKEVYYTYKYLVLESLYQQVNVGNQHEPRKTPMHFKNARFLLLLRLKFS
jgi:hypothetical protein